MRCSKLNIALVFLLSFSSIGVSQEKESENNFEWGAEIDGLYSFSGIKTAFSASFQSQKLYLKLGGIINHSVFSLTQKPTPGTFFSVGLIHKDYKINDRLNHSFFYHTIQFQHVWTPVVDHYHAHDLNLVFTLHYRVGNHFECKGGFGMGGLVNIYSSQQNKTTEFSLQPVINAGIAYVW